MSTDSLRIVFLDAATFGDMSLQRFQECWNCTVHQTTPSDKTAERLAGHTVAVTNKVVIDQAAMEATGSRDLQLIVVAATGTDIIDKGSAARRGVKVCNVPGYATQSVAQFTLAMMLELSVRVGSYSQAVKAGDWERSPVFSLFTFPTAELSGKKLGIVGFGNIGQAVASMARAFGMDILISARPGGVEPIANGRTSLDRLLRQADIISLHCPLTKETEHLINARSLGMMKPTAFLINTARGGLVDESALIQALRERRIGGAALDVISREPPPADHPIIQATRTLDNLLITPHTAWSARETRARLLGVVEANISAFLAGNPRNLVV